MRAWKLLHSLLSHFVSSYHFISIPHIIHCPINCSSRKRYRTASRSRLACADVLLCHGYYALASDSYFEAIHNGAGTEEGMVVSLMGSGHSCGTFWAELRRSVLLKILYCASALCCKVTCIKAALLLHASICIPSAPDFYTKDLSLSAVDKIDQVGIGASRDHEGAVHAFLPYFEIETQSIAVREEPSKLFLLPGDCGGEIDDGVRGRVEVISEGNYSICLNILSRFPCVIELDEVCVIFEATPTLIGNDCLIGSMDSEDFMRLGSPRCFTAALTMRSDEAITLHPAVSQALSLPFLAPSYCPSYDNYSVMQVKAVIKGRKAERAGFGFEGTGFLGIETISFVHKKTQPLAESSSSKESSQLSPRTSVSTSSPEVQLREKSIATMCFMPFVPVICVKHVSQSSTEISSALGAAESEHAVVDGASANPLVKVDVADRRDSEKQPGTDKGKATCPIEALVSAPLITPSRITPLLTNGTALELCPLHAHNLDFLAKINLSNTSLKAVRIERVVLCCSDFELSDVLNDLSCVCAANTHCKMRLTRTWTSLVLLPGESYSAILHCNFISKISAADAAPTSNLMAAECSKEEERETVSKTGDRKKPYLLLDCYEEDETVPPLMSSSNNGSGQSNSSFSNLVVCLQSTCRSIARDLWHAAFTSPSEIKDSNTPLYLSANHRELTHELKQGEGGAAGTQNSRGQNNRILQVARAETETSQIQRQRVLTKAVKTDRLIFFSPSSW